MYMLKKICSRLEVCKKIFNVASICHSQYQYHKGQVCTKQPR